MKLDDEAARFHRHLRELRDARGRLRYGERTAYDYALVLNRVLRIGDPARVLREVRTSSRHTVVLSAIKAWAAWRGDPALVEAAKRVPSPDTGQRRTRAPSDDEWRRIMDAVSRAAPPMRHVLHLVVTSGLRINEVFELTRADAQTALVAQSIEIRQKGGKPRTFIVLPEHRDGLRELLGCAKWTRLRDLYDPYPPHAAKTDRQRYDRAYHEVRKALRRICADAGVEYVRPHRYRHAIACAMADTGADPGRISDALGHASTDTTVQYYLHPDLGRQAESQARALRKVRGS